MEHKNNTQPEYNSVESNENSVAAAISLGLSEISTLDPQVKAGGSPKRKLFSYPLLLEGIRKNLKTGQATSMVVKNNDSISVSAEPDTEITLENLSDDPIQATCST